MIFYYSATGNSFWMAKSLAERQGERLVCVTDELKQGATLQYTVKQSETIGFVFPVHAWNPPDTLMHFLKKMTLTGYTNQYVFAIATCGDTSGDNMRVFKKRLAEKGLALNAYCDVEMPNNYLPLQDVDSPERENEKLNNAEKSLERITENIAALRHFEWQIDGEKHRAFKTSVIGFFFRHFGKFTFPFYATDACTGCGLCERICLKNIIRIKNGRPCWKGKCDQCYACIHRCPSKAIQYGKKTLLQGRYCHPIIRTKTGRY